MIFFKAQRMQQLAQQLLALQRRLEAGSGDTTHIREGLEEVARRVGVDLEIVRLAHPDTVLDVLAPEGGGDPGKVWAVAEVLFLDGIRARAEGEPGEGLDALRKARYLYRTLGEGLVLPDEATPPDQRLDTLGAILSDPA